MKNKLVFTFLAFTLASAPVFAFRGGEGGGEGRGDSGWGNYGQDRGAYDAGYRRAENNNAAANAAGPIDDIDDDGEIWPPQDAPPGQNQGEPQLGVPNPEGRD